MVNKEDNTIAIVSYLTLVGWFVAVVLHDRSKTQLGSFHLRQTLGIYILAIGISVFNFILSELPLIGVLFTIAFGIMALALLLFWLLGLMTAINGQMKPLPLIGETIQNLLKNAFL